MNRLSPRIPVFSLQTPLILVLAGFTAACGTESGPAQPPPNGSALREQIAFATDRDGTLEIYVMNADGSNPVNISNHPAFDISPAWSP